MTSVPPCFGLPCAKTSPGSRTAPDDAARACRKLRRLTLDIAPPWMNFPPRSCPPGGGVSRLGRPGATDMPGLSYRLPGGMLRGRGGAVFHELIGRPREQEA